MLRGNGGYISVENVAKSANIGKGSVYYYFASQEDIWYALVERAFKRVKNEYFSVVDLNQNIIKKIELLYVCTIKKTFSDGRINIIRTLHMNNNLILHNYIKKAAVFQLAPILEKLLIQGTHENFLKTDYPKEASEIIVSILTFIHDGTVFSDDEEKIKKIEVLVRILEDTLKCPRDSWGFLKNIDYLRD
jgi:AcrR family transcriptional regulator